jgi:hypothetical protein
MRNRETEELTVVCGGLVRNNFFPVGLPDYSPFRMLDNDVITIETT